MGDIDTVAFSMIGDKKISNVDVARTLTAGSLAVFLHFNGTLVILVKNRASNGVALSFHKKLDIKGIG